MPQSFEEIYMETLWDTEVTTSDSVLSREKVEEFQSYDDLGEMMEDLNSYIGAEIPHGLADENAEVLRKAVHNDLGFSADEIRVMENGDPEVGWYNSIFRKNDDGDWVKDLAVTSTPDGGELSYVRHDEPESEIDKGSEAEDGLWQAWPEGYDTRRALKGGLTPMTAFFELDTPQFEDPDISQERIDDYMHYIDLGNDSVVVGDEQGEAEVGWEHAAAKRYARIANFHMNDEFNDEMAIIEEATEAYHNSYKPYVNIRLKNDELTAEASEEHIRPHQTYNVKDIDRK